MKNEVSTEQLQKRLAEVKAEQRQTQAAIAGFDASITASQAAMKSAQARYDLRGDDAAKDEVTEQRSLIQVNEERRRRAQEQLAEFPARIEAIRREIGVIGYREDLRRLIVLRQAEVETFNLAEQTILDAIETWRNFISAKEQRAQLARTCENFARANSLPIPHSGAFGHPLPSEVWFTSPGMMAQVQAMFDKARREIPA